jgi:hypothetical protein
MAGFSIFAWYILKLSIYCQFPGSLISIFSWSGRVELPMIGRVSFHNYYDDTDRIKVQFNFEFCIRREQFINYSHIISLYRLLYLYDYMVRRNVIRFASASLPKSSVTIHALFKPTYYILRLGTVVINVILWQRKCCSPLLKIMR